MPVNVYLVFNGDAEEALHYYQKAFQSRQPHIQRFKEIPGYEEHVPPGSKDRVLHGRITIFGDTIMVSDTMPGQEHTVGNNITLAALSDDKAAIQHAFDLLVKDGELVMELQATPWSELYGQVTDRYGILWQFNYLSPDASI